MTTIAIDKISKIVGPDQKEIAANNTNPPSYDIDAPGQGSGRRDTYTITISGPYLEIAECASLVGSGSKLLEISQVSQPQQNTFQGRFQVSESDIGEYFLVMCESGGSCKTDPLGHDNACTGGMAAYHKVTTHAPLWAEAKKQKEE